MSGGSGRQLINLCVPSQYGLMAEAPHPEGDGFAPSWHGFPGRHDDVESPRTRIGPSGQRITEALAGFRGISFTSASDRGVGRGRSGRGGYERPQRGPVVFPGIHKVGGEARVNAGHRRRPKRTSSRRSGSASTRPPARSRPLLPWTASASTCSSKYPVTAASKPRRRIRSRTAGSGERKSSRTSPDALQWLRGAAGSTRTRTSCSPRPE